MKIYILTAVFPPEPLVTGKMSVDLANKLSEKGHEVIVISPFPNRPGGILYKGYRRNLIFCEKREEYHLIHTWHTLSKKSTFFSRFFENLTFGITSSLWLLKNGHADVAYVNTWAIFSQFLNCFTLKLLRIPTVCVVTDIYPESLINKKIILKDSLISKILSFIDKLSLKICKKIITLTPTMRKLLIQSRGILPNKIITIPVWIDEAEWEICSIMDKTYSRDLGISDDIFLLVFTGNFSITSGLDLFIKIAEILKKQKNILFIFAGDGTQKNRIQKEIKNRNLYNILIISPLSNETLLKIHAAADIFLLNLKSGMSASNLPSKQIVYMMSGKPIIASLDLEDDPAKIIIESQSGFVFPPESTIALANMIYSLSLDRSKLSEMGKNARMYAIKNFSKREVLPKMIDILITSH